ncbi:hypothetical protein Tco_0356052 [Tanacetum coccineum]
MIIKKDSEIVKAKGERKSLALKAKKESSDDERLTFGSEDEEYAMAVRDFKKFFKRRECPKPSKDQNQRAFVGGSWSDSDEEDDECGNQSIVVALGIKENFDYLEHRCGDPNHLIGECPKPPKDKNQISFVEGSWSDSGEEDDEKVKNETCLVAQASSEEALFSMGNDKSSGPDGYTAAFFKEAWDIVGQDVIKAVKEFFTISG